MVESRHHRCAPEQGSRLGAICALALLLLAPPATAADDQVPRPWYQVEIILFANDSASAQTLETLVSEEQARQPSVALALGPVWPEQVRPQRTAELQMLWDGADERPRLDRVTPGMDPETERLMRWLQRLGARSRSPDLSWLYGLDFIQWRDGGGAERLAVPRPVPRIQPRVEFVTAAGAVSTQSMPADDAADSVVDADDIPVPLALAFRDVAPEQRLLATDAGRLARARDFRILQHLAWRQPFEAEAPAIPVMVRWADPDTGEVMLVGSVGVGLRRYLHVDFDLRWREGAAEAAPGEQRPGPTAEWAPIRQSRRMRSGELHYVDHPRIGALVRITPFALAAPLTRDLPLEPAFGN